MLRLITAVIVFMMPVVSITTDRTELPQTSRDLIDECGNNGCEEGSGTSSGFSQGGTWRVEREQG